MDRPSPFGKAAIQGINDPPAAMESTGAQEHWAQWEHWEHWEHREIERH